MLALAGASYALLQSAVAPALPAIQADLHASASATAWLFTGYLLSASVLTPVGGQLGASLAAGTVTAAGLPTDHGFTLAFLLAAGACLLAGLASIAVPKPPRPQLAGALTPATAPES